MPLSDKRIGLIGTGSTGVQIVSALGGKLERLSVFQRSPQWVMPWLNPRYGPWTKAAIRRWPALGKPGYWFWGSPKTRPTSTSGGSLRSAMPQTTWVSGCDSWYLGKDGLPEVFPWVPERHSELLRDRVVRDFDIQPA